DSFSLRCVAGGAAFVAGQRRQRKQRNDTGTTVPTPCPPGTMTEHPFEILYEDYHLLAVSKPAPLLTQSVPPVPSLEAQVKAYLKEQYAKPGNVYLGVPHRLDRPVSGALVFARNTKASRRLAEQFQGHTVEKVYWALVEGAVP